MSLQQIFAPEMYALREFEDLFVVKQDSRKSVTDLFREIDYLT